MTRLHDWALRLEAIEASRLATPFEWGVHDCCLWAADCAQAVTGNDPAAALRGTYSTRDEAYAVIAGFGMLGDVATALLGPEVSVLLAQTGDIGLIEDDAGQEALAVYMGGPWLAAQPSGLVVVPSHQVTRVWRCEVS